MIVLTVNSGSTSVRLAVHDAVPGSAHTLLFSERCSGPENAPHAFLRRLMEKIPRPPEAVAHRVVHGGMRFAAPVRIDEAVMSAIGELRGLAPLHNPKALEWMAAARELWSGVAQVAVFDTAFFANLPRVAAEYALPAHIGTELGVRRYGFHGLAHESMWRRWCELHPDTPRGGRLITLQLGGGCSIAAIDRGCPVDTSMGFSPLEGLMMATRSGDIDAAVVPYLQDRLGATGGQIVELLNTGSGLAGVSGIDGNPAVLLADPSPRAQFAIELYCYRVRKYIGAYLAVLGGCDGIVFGGGVGENVPGVRERILAGMQWAGIELDPAANQAARGHEARIDAGSAVKVHVARVDEEAALVCAALQALA
jgi:acetate kinase